MMLCSKCLSMFSPYRNEDRFEIREHHANETDLARAADGGCKICIGIHRRYLERKTSLIKSFEGGTEPVFFEYTVAPEDGETAWICFYAQAPFPGGYELFKNIKVYKSSSLPGQEQCSGESTVEQSSLDELRGVPWRVRYNGSLKSYPKSTGHPNVAERASLWLKTCLESHATCRALDQAARDVASGWQPKRLLDVRDPRKPRLVITALDQAKGGYATLSHCWGKKLGFMTLSSQTEDSLRRGISFKQLPKTFQDAIFTTKRLGIGYLWIDSLCILQGSKEDWEEHVTAMRKVYQHCLVNIAADRASSPHEGAFVQRSAAALKSCEVFWDIGRGGPSMWTVMDDTDLNGHFFNGHFFDAPLTHRAWVFQERFLAPRVLHLGMEYVWWECADLGFASEVIPNGMRRKHPDFGLAAAPFSIPRKLSEPGSEWPAITHQDIVLLEWQRAVMKYANMELTYVEKDVFAALAGVAEQFGSRFYDHDYIAGYFRSELPWDLMWTIEGTGRPKGRPYRAPTWSWGSVSNAAKSFKNGRFLWHEPQQVRQHGLKTLALLKDTRVELLDEKNIYGPVKYAEVTLKAVLFECFRLDNHPALRRDAESLHAQEDQDQDQDQEEEGGEEEEEALKNSNVAPSDSDAAPHFSGPHIDGNGNDYDFAAPMLNPFRNPKAHSYSTEWGVARSVAEVATPELFESRNPHLPFLTPYVRIRPDDPELLEQGSAFALPIFKDVPGYEGILVRPVAVREGRSENNSSTCYYERVGTFFTSNSDSLNIIELIRREILVMRDVVLI